MHGKAGMRVEFGELKFSVAGAWSWSGKGREDTGKVGRGQSCQAL